MEFASRFNSTWKGSYFDLYEKKLRVEVWDWNKFATNNFVAAHEVSLVSIARGSMGQEMAITGEFKEPGKVKKEMRCAQAGWPTACHRKGGCSLRGCSSPRWRRRQVGTLNFVCVLQEVVDFEVKLLDWEANLHTLVFAPQDEVEVEDIKYASLATFDLNKQSRGLLERAKQHVSSRVDRQQPGEVDVLRTHYSVPSGMHLRGTRNDIEDSVLDVNLFEVTMGFRRDLMCFTRMPLKGVTISGFTQSQLGYYYTHRVLKDGGGSYTKKELKQAGDIKGQVDVSVPGSPLWKEFAQVGDLNPPELRDVPPHNYTYLAVKVVRAQGLPPSDENGLSDPYFALEWGGQRQETRVKRRTLNPSFNETLYFHVRSYQEFPTVDDVSKFPDVTIHAWDHDEGGVSESLGTTKLYLHEITGSVRDGRPVTQKPLQRIKIKTRKSRWNPKQVETEVRTRVYRGRQPLSHADPMVKGSVHLEVRCPPPLSRSCWASPAVYAGPSRRGSAARRPSAATLWTCSNTTTGGGACTVTS